MRALTQLGLSFLGALLAAAPCMAGSGCPFDCPVSMDPELAGNSGTAGSFAQRRSGDEIDADVKIGVIARGIQKVGYAQLVAAGLDPSCLVGGDIRMYCRTNEVAITVSADGLWSTNDFLLFYGLPLDGYYTVTNVYWLGLTPGGARMTSRNAVPLAGAPTITTSCRRIAYEPDALYRAFYEPLEDSFDHWFASLVRGGVTTNFPFANENLDTTRTGVVRITIWGLGSATNNPDHHSIVRINGASITNLLYDGEVVATAETPFVSSLLTPVTSTVGVEQVLLPGVSSNFAGQLEKFEFHFPRLTHLIGGRLGFGGEASSNNYLVDAFSASNGNMVLDVSDPFAPVQLTNATVQATTNGFSLTFGDTVSSSRCYFASSTGGFRTVASVNRVRFRNLADTNRQADYIVICPYEFRTNAYKLLKHRSKNGLAVAVAPLSDIYDEFGYGITDAAAIKQFVGYAFHHWAGPAPRYLLLLGDGTFDPKANLGPNEPNNWVPVKLGPTPFNWTAMDNWYADVNGTNDNLIDLSVGRIPATNDVSLGYVVDKMITYEGLSSTNSWRTKAIVVSDVSSNGFDFVGATTSDVTPRLLAGGVSNITSYRRDLQSAVVINAGISSGINSGRLLVNFMGHGAEDRWTSDPVWQNSDVLALNNGVWPIVTVFTCKNGIFQNTNYVSLVEAFLLRQNRGAVACVAPTELSVETFAEKIADGFFQSFGANNEPRLGDSLNVGLSNLYFNGNSSAYELMGYQVFGDPALLVYPP